MGFGRIRLRVDACKLQVFCSRALRLAVLAVAIVNRSQGWYERPRSRLAKNPNDPEAARNDDPADILDGS